MLPTAMWWCATFNNYMLKCKQGRGFHVCINFSRALLAHHCHEDSPPLATLFAGSPRPILLLSCGVCCGVVVVILFIRGRQGSGC